MYLFTFVMLMLSLLGIYTQVVAIQSAKIFANQTALAQIMATWHTAAVGLAKGDSVIGASSTACSISVVNTGGMAACKNASGKPVFLPSTFNGTAPTSPLSPGYNSTQYQWYSAVYQTAAYGGKRLVVTFVLPGAASSSLITQPSIGISIGELLLEFKKSNFPAGSYGVVSGQLLTNSLNSNYPMPTGGAITDGSIALVSLI